MIRWNNRLGGWRGAGAQRPRSTRSGRGKRWAAPATGPAVIALLLSFMLHSVCFAKNNAEEIVDEDTTIITSDGGLNMDYNRHVALFKKNVVVRDHRGTLNAQEMRVFFEPQGSQIKRIEATGDVRIMQEGRLSESQKAVVQYAEGLIELTGDPKIKQGKDIYSADKITIHTRTNQIVFEPGAKLIIFQAPGQKKDLFR